MNLLQNSSFMFLLAVFIGLFLPGLAESLKDFVIPVLAVIMTLSLIGLKFSDIRATAIIPYLLLNYVFLSGIIVLSTLLLIDDRDLMLGFFVMAAAPPAVAIVPFSKLLEADAAEAAISNAGIYMTSLLLTPLIMLLLTGSSASFFEILEALIILIVLPIIVSRFLHIKRTKESINIGFFIVIYTVIGLNVENLSFYLYPVIIIAILRTFFSGSIILFASLKNETIFETSMVRALFASYKNLGFTAGVALVIFGEEASIPAAICILFEVLLFNYYSVLKSNIKS